MITTPLHSVFFPSKGGAGLIFHYSMALLLQRLMIGFKRRSFEGREAMGYFGTTGRRLKEIMGRVTGYSWLISASSLVWFLLRTGSNPSPIHLPLPGNGLRRVTGPVGGREEKQSRI